MHPIRSLFVCIDFVAHCLILRLQLCSINNDCYCNQLFSFSVINNTMHVLSTSLILHEL